MTAPERSEGEGLILFFEKECINHTYNMHKTHEVREKQLYKQQMNPRPRAVILEFRSVCEYVSVGSGIANLMQKNMQGVVLAYKSIDQSRFWKILLKVVLTKIQFFEIFKVV